MGQSVFSKRLVATEHAVTESADHKSAAFRQRHTAFTGRHSAREVTREAMPPRPNPFLERRLRSPPAPTDQPRMFQTMRDWTGFLVSIIALVTSVAALWNTLKGPEPKIAQLKGDLITIFNSSAATVGETTLPSKNEADQKDSFPLILVQPLIYNKATTSNSVAIRRFGGVFRITRGADTIFVANYLWFRITQSDSATGPDGLITLKVKQIDQP
jgi:hypothetical protein